MTAKGRQGKKEGAERFRAVLVIPGQPRMIVFPRSRKTSLFDSVGAAEKALDRRARHLPVDARGEVLNASGEVVLYIAL